MSDFVRGRRIIDPLGIRDAELVSSPTVNVDSAHVVSLTSYVVLPADEQQSYEILTKVLSARLEEALLIRSHLTPPDKLDVIIFRIEITDAVQK